MTKTGLSIVLLASAILAGKFDLGGYVKNFNTAVYPPNIEGVPLPEITGASSYRLNLKATYSPLNFLTMKVSYDLMPRFTGEMMNYLESGLTTEENEAGSYRIDDLPRVISPSDYDGTGFAIMQNLDRAFVSIDIPELSLELGRQPIAWGSARGGNPSDILTPFSYDALDVEERSGVDAIRLRVPLGAMSEIDAGYLPGYKFDEANSAIFARAKGYFFETDISATTVYFRDNMLFGIDLARSIGGAGTWIEAAHIEPRKGNYFFRLTAGADYILSDGTYLFGEYHFNGAGTDKPANYLANTDNIAYKECNVYLMGKHYAMAGIAHPITPLFSGSLNAMWNLNDYSALITPNLEYNFAQDVYISLGANLGFGKGGIESSGGLTFNGKSEFGIYPDMWFMSFRFYF